MKKLNFSLLTLVALLLFGLASCSKSDNSNLEHLLGTVPADAGMVLVADLPTMLNDAGCKIEKNGAVQLTPELTKAMKGNRDIAWLAASLEKGEAGLMAAPIVYFTEGDVFYITGLIDDTEKFMHMMAEQQGEEFREEQGVSIAGYCAVKGNQFWYSRSSLGAKEINRFTGLSEKRSFLSNDACQMLLENDNDIRGISDIVSFLSLTGAGNNAMTGIVSSALFKDIEYAFIEADFDKGEAEAEVRILDSKLNNAKFLLPVEKIDKKVVELIGETSDAVFALNLNKRLINKLSDFQQFMPSDLITLLAPVDGTVAYGSSREAHNLRWIVQTDGENATPLITEVTNMGASLNQQGNTLIFSEGKVGGELLVKDCAEKLDDAFFGIIVTPGQYAVINEVPSFGEAGGEVAALPAASASLPEGVKPFRSFSLLLEPDGNSLKVKVKLTLNDKKAPSLAPALGLLK